jgi:hypothetical protein
MQVPWYKDTNLCRGLCDYHTRGRDILRFKVLPEELKTVKVAVSKEVADLILQGKNEAKSRRFLCFGFEYDESKSLFMMPGWLIKHVHAFSFSQI